MEILLNHLESVGRFSVFHDLCYSWPFPSRACLDHPQFVQQGAGQKAQGHGIFHLQWRLIAVQDILQRGEHTPHSTIGLSMGFIAKKGWMLIDLDQLD
jgi:hypothetical protein